MFAMLSEEQVNTMAAEAYLQELSKGRKAKLLNKDQAEVRRLRKIAGRLIGQVGIYRKDATGWQWEVNLLEDEQLNAYCMPGGKIMFYSGILDKLKLTDDEVAAIWVMRWLTHSGSMAAKPCPRLMLFNWEKMLCRFYWGSTPMDWLTQC